MPFERLISILREPHSFEEFETARKDAADVLERIAPFAALTLEAIEADRADCLLIRGDPPNRRYVTVQDAVLALQRTLLIADRIDAL
jgi:hypothetical protein